MPNVVECRLELYVGNGYRIQCSSDGIHWSTGIDAGQVQMRQGIDQTDAAWIRMLDVTKYLGSRKTVYLKFSDMGDRKKYSGQTAFLRRISAYTIMLSDTLFIKLSNVSESNNKAFTLRDITFRKW
jgi:hypothetical protein